MLRINKLLLDEVLARLATPLSDPGLDRDLRTLELEDPPSMKLAGATFALGGSLSLSLFNSEDDVDPEAVIGVPREDPSEAFSFTPQLTFDLAHSWLKYSVDARIKAGTSGGLGALGFTLDASRSLTLASYRRHSPNETVAGAVRADLGSFKSILSPADISSLPEGDALGLHARFGIKGSLELRWADVFSRALGALGSSLARDELLAVKISSSVGAELSYTIEDDCSLVFSRTKNGWVRLSVLKTDERSFAATIGIKVSAEHVKPEAIETASRSALDGLAGMPAAEVTALLSKSSLSALGKRERTLFDGLTRRLGLDRQTAGIENLKARWETLREELPGKIKALAASKLEAGLSYEYSRIRSNSVLLQALIRDTAISGHHEALLKGHLSPLLQDIRAKRDTVVLERYLNESTLETRKAFGFTLGTEKWAISGKTLKRVKTIVRRDISGKELVCFDAARVYSGQWGKGRVSWTVDLDASMNQYSRSTPAPATEFTYGLHLTFEWAAAKPKTPFLNEVLDHAIVWKIIAPGDFKEAKERLHSECSQSETVIFTAQLVLDDYSVRWILHHVENQPELRFASSLGAAMPWHEQFPGLRQSVELREKYYGSLWNEYLRNPSMSPSSLAQAAEATLRDKDRSLARYEGEKHRIDRLRTIGGLAALNHRMRRQWSSFLGGVRLLRDAVDRGEPYERIGEAFESISDLGAQAHHVRAMGAYFLDLAWLGTEPVRSRVERVLTVSYGGSEGDEQLINMGVSRGEVG
jgi:hypothetical protein